MGICAVSADLTTYYIQQERRQESDRERDSYVKYRASMMADEQQPYEIMMSCEGLDVVEAINSIVKAKTSSELFDARQMLLDCIAEEAIRIAERTTE